MPSAVVVVMPAAVLIDGLTKDYPVGWRKAPRRALDRLSLEVPLGGVFGLLGPNGAGKSTTLRILAGIVRPVRGTVHIEGYALPGRAVAVKRRIGYVPDAAELYECLSALEFLELCGRLHGLDERSLQARVDALLDGFELSDRREHRLGSYSKGMRQKILIAAALLHDPSLILLDEPLTGLDVDSAMLVKDLLAALASYGKTVVYSSHVLDVVERVCSRVLVIDRGRLVADGTPDALKGVAGERSLEAVFRQLTRTGSSAPRVRTIVEGLRA